MKGDEVKLEVSAVQKDIIRKAKNFTELVLNV